MAEPESASLIARGLADQDAGRHQAAVQLLQQAARQGGASASLYCRIGRSYEALKDYGAADAAYAAAIEQEPDSAEAYLLASDLARRVGALARRAGQTATARELRRASCQYLVALGARRGKSGAWAEAEAAFRKALAIEPELWSVHAELGRALYQLYRHREGEAAIRAALRLAPREPAAHYQLGAVLVRQGRTSEAAASFEAALALDPAYAPARTALAEALRLEGKTEAAEAAYRAAASADPEARRGLYLLGPIYDGAPAEQILERHRAWGDAVLAAARPVAAEAAPFPNSRDPARRLRIGYVSPDFRQHSVAYFLEPLLANHDPEAVEIFCYAEVQRPDALTERFQALARQWRSTIGLDDLAFRRQVRADGIDILIDLAGHTAGNRLAAFAVKLAPVTASWLGYPTTTGLATIDWRVTDAIADPPGAEAQHVERLLRLDRCFLAFAPPDNAPDVSPLPAARTGHVTFGSFNNSLKITPGTLAAWAELLARVPESRLLVKAFLLRDDGAKARFLEQLLRAGVAPHRVELRGGTNTTNEHLAAYGDVDVALDTFPYNGTATTCEALWMGVPVVTLAGDRHCARVGASLLGSAGLGHLVQSGADAYIAAAARLAADLPGLAALRTGLRAQLAQSPLCDGRAFARSFEAALRRGWRQWC